MNLDLHAGAAVMDITPTRPAFLFGYPHVPRLSTGTHDPLLASALVLSNEQESCLFIAVDVICVSKALTQRIRRRISETTGIREAAILLSATHTHSGPITVSYLSNEADPVVPPVDPAYLRALEEGIVQAGVAAWKARRPAELAITHADATGIGTNRHDSAGPSDLDVPVLAVRDRRTHQFIGILLVCAMHPTVLHEDSTRFSGDFPAFARQGLRRRLEAPDCPIIYHTGAAGDQSPRHVTRSNTFEEAARLGEILASAVADALREARYCDDVPLATAQQFVPLPARTPPRVEDAERQLQFAQGRLNALRGPGTPRTVLRTAECDWFGAQETLAIARAAEQGRLHATLDTCLPAEIQVLCVGSHAFIAWPGEFFVEFALRVKQKHPTTTIITLANGELQGYVVTQQAITHRWYEAGNALLQSPEAGDLMTAATIDLLKDILRPVHA